MESVHGYEIKTALDFFKKLLDEREDFLKNPTSSRFAINCAITGWHLHEWVYNEYKANDFLKQFTSKKEFRNYLYKQEDFEVLHDLADGSKHFALTQRKSKVSKTRLLTKEAAPAHWKINSPTLMITYGFNMSFDDLLYLITHFWYTFFRDKLGVDVSKIFDENGYSYF